MRSTVLFDIDGTLLDSVDAHAAAWSEAFAAFGYEVPAERVRPMIGMGGDRILPEIDPNLREDAPPGSQIGERRAAIFKERYLASLRPTNGARALVERLAELGRTLVVASSAQGEELHGLLRQAQVDDLFALRTSKDDASTSKPAPDIVHAALERAGARPSDAVYIGDTRYDVDAAQRAGVVPIALRCGGADPATLSGAAAIYADPAELLAELATSPLA